MTKKEVLAKVREIAPGEYSDERVLDLIEECNQRIWREMLDGYVVEETGGELAAPPPYDSLYLWWALANVALLQQDIGAYNNHMQMFNSQWMEYGRMISRTYSRERVNTYRI